MALRCSKTAPVVISGLVTAALEIVIAAAAAGVKLAQVLSDVALDPLVHVLHPEQREVLERFYLRNNSVSRQCKHKTCKCVIIDNQKFGSLFTNRRAVFKSEHVKHLCSHLT